jgi:hypothetical protein
LDSKRKGNKWQNVDRGPCLNFGLFFDFENMIAIAVLFAALAIFVPVPYGPVDFALISPLCTAPACLDTADICPVWSLPGISIFKA